ncbi:lyase family protein [Arenicella xantha]
MGQIPKHRIEQDSMGKVRVANSALYGAQTQRAIDNFNISDLKFSKSFIQSLALVKKTAATVNAELGLLDQPKADAIAQAADQILAGKHLTQFPLDIFQTGSGTSTNMNMNEVLTTICRRDFGVEVHPNDHVNLGQSSNDVIPTTIQVASLTDLTENLIPAFNQLIEAIDHRTNELMYVAKTGRTHLMDAMPLTFGQELSGWSSQIRSALINLEDFTLSLAALPQGGTAVGTGVNTDERFAECFANKISDFSGHEFSVSDNFFRGLSSQDLSVGLSGHLRVLAVSLNKIATDLRWMNSGPLAGIAEIELEALQPGSSIMPGKVNPVIPEAVSMACAQVIGNDATITVGAMSSNFQLNVMLPVIAYNLLQSIELLSNSATHLGELGIRRFSVNTGNVTETLASNPILATALNPIIGYEQAAKIAKLAYASNRPVIDVAVENTDLSRDELEKLLNPMHLTNARRDNGE